MVRMPEIKLYRKRTFFLLCCKIGFSKRFNRVGLSDEQTISFVVRKLIHKPQVSLQNNSTDRCVREGKIFAKKIN